MSKFVLGKKSLAELEGVAPALVRVVKRAIEVTPVDFVVHDGIRTVAEQRQYVKLGTSKTMNSLHLQGKAVDLVPYIDGAPRWLWPPIYQIAASMLIAAREQQANILWGVVWDRPMLSLAKGVTGLQAIADALQQEGLDYNQRHAGKDFPDGPHFQMVS